MASCGEFLPIIVSGWIPMQLGQKRSGHCREVSVSSGLTVLLRGLMFEELSPFVLEVRLCFKPLTPLTHCPKLEKLIITHC